MIIIETLLQNQKVLVHSKNIMTKQSNNENQKVNSLKETKEFKILRNLEENLLTNNTQIDTNNTDENKLNKTIENNSTKHPSDPNSQGFLKEDIKNSTQINEINNNKTTIENKEVNAPNLKGPENEKNKTYKSNKTEAIKTETDSNSTSNEKSKEINSGEEQEEKGESLKVDLIDSNKTQSKGSKSELNDSQNASPHVEEIKDEVKKSISQPKNETKKEKTEIESLSEAFNNIKNSNNNVKHEEVKEDTAAIGTSKTIKDTSAIAPNENNNKSELNNSDNEDRKKSEEQ